MPFGGTSWPTLFASVSAVLLGAGQLSLPLLAGGTLIVAAALLSVLER